MSQFPKEFPKGSNPPKKDDSDKRLDEAVDETFPASDPVAPDAAKPARRKKSAEDAVERELDDALEDTFPASDPLPLHDPDQPEEPRP